MENYILTEHKNSLLHIRFNRPEKMNAINLAMYAQLVSAFEHAENNKNINAILISSTSDHFTSGNDLHDFINIAHDIQNSVIVRFIKKLASFKKPLIAGVKGNAIGIGTTLLLHCDLVYATQCANFLTPFTQLSLVPEAASSYLLPKLIGAAKANKMLLLSEPINAQEAFNCGLITELHGEDDFDSFIVSKAQKIANMPAEAILRTKALIRKNNVAISARIDEELTDFSDLLSQDEFIAIAQNFINKK